jgi:hypothetical protein
VPDDSKRSKRELLDEYSRIVTFIRRPECLRRVREIIDELRKRSVGAQPAPKGRRLPT